MSIHAPMVNENYDPTENDEKVLEALKRGRESGDPWGRANRVWISQQTGLDKSNAEFCIRSLRDAGWIRREARGLYEFVEDPRETANKEGNNDPSENQQ
jgi:DNA-binding IclR family transcriptional regulator